MKVKAFLKTPLYRSRQGGSDGSELTESVLVICGTATTREGGIEVAVSSLADDKGQEVASPFERIFLPMGKIDYYIIEEA